MDTAILKINSNTFQGWKAFSISKSLETISGAFALSITDKWDSKIWPIKAGDECELFINEDKLISGYVDSVQTSVSKDDRVIEISGRDKTADLVDSSIDGMGPQFSSLKLEKLCETLCAPFGISVVLGTGVDTGAPLVNISSSVGETVFCLLEKRARQKGLLLIFNSDGALEITTPGKTFSLTALEQGKNIVSCSSQYDVKDRFSSYKVKGQNGFDENGTGGFQTLGKATDVNVPRYRPLVISADTQTTNAEAKKRAEFEAITRAARAIKVSVSVQGFRQITGELWELNKIVRVIAPAIGVVDDELLISDITYSLDDGGSVTTFGLKRKDAFIAVPEVTKDAEPSYGDLDE